MRAGKQSDTSIAYVARPACRAIAQAPHLGRSLPRALVAVQHGHGSMPGRNICWMMSGFMTTTESTFGRLGPTYGRLAASRLESAGERHR
jgi:hypothetical protein